MFTSWNVLPWKPSGVTLSIRDLFEWIWKRSLHITCIRGVWCHRLAGQRRAEQDYRTSVSPSALCFRPAMHRFIQGHAAQMSKAVFVSVFFLWRDASGPQKPAADRRLDVSRRDLDDCVGLLGANWPKCPHARSRLIHSHRFPIFN